jgi:hypothetical protein
MVEMRKENPPQVRVVFDGIMRERFEKVKRYYGLQKNADLIRLLVTEKHEKLGLPLELPRFEQINSDENGVKILDRQIHEVADIYVKPEGIKCLLDESDDCEHIAFALSLPKVKETIRKHKKEGWNLP